MDDLISRAWGILMSDSNENNKTKLKRGCSVATGRVLQGSLRYCNGEVMMWVVSEMLRSMTGPSYVPRESVCTSTQQEPPRQVEVKYEAQRNEEEQPGIFEQLLYLDQQLTLSFGSCARPVTPLQRLLKTCCMCLEMSGHGVPWFVLSGLLMVLYFLTGGDDYFIYGANLFFVLIMDIIVVAPIKLFFKRPRPSVNCGSIPLSMSSIDGYAFPSGHASRCVALAAYFCYMPPFYLRTHLWYIWAVTVSLSRVVICRHHISDVGAGILAGLFIFELVRRFGLLYGV